jgi:hypothetical protein
MKDKKLKKAIAKMEATLEALLKSLNKQVYFDEYDMDEDDDPYFKAVLVKRKKYPWD